VRIPPGTSSGRQLRVRGRGLPRGAGERGDLYVVVNIEVPDHLSAEERHLWEQLRRVSRFNPRPS
jgi:curved DNA-binding protein